MALPALSSPEFMTEIPSTKQKIKFRPFLVKEEKILYMALEGQDPIEITNAIQNTLESCILTEGIDVAKLATFDIEHLFLQLRGKSVGEEVEIVLRHKELEKECERLCKELKIKGPCCIQWKEERAGKPKLIECNPRLGGGTFFSTLAGVNPAKIYLEDIKQKQYPKEIKVTRYFEEIVTS